MGVNVGAELSIGEYLRIAPAILSKNEYQRKRVKSSGTYELLRKDLIEGCVMPPIILAVTSAYGSELENLVRRAIIEQDSFTDWASIFAFIERAAQDGELLILDGLQRTLTIEGIGTDKDGGISKEKISEFFGHKIRVEIYVGLSKTGILYRMLTLNTGQTPMSFRHQLEILYYDYIDNNALPDGISILKEVDEKRARGVGRYKYADVVDMFYAYSTGTPMPYDKQALVGELREINFLESYRYKADADDMQHLLEVYNHLIKIIDSRAGDWTAESQEDGGLIRPFGSNVCSILARPQPMAGFGAECKRLIKVGAVPEISTIDAAIEELRFSEDPSTSLNQLLLILDQIAKKAKRIGDAQRAYFQFAFRAMLLPSSDAYLDLSKCWLKGQEDFEMMY
ncbi:hypothetical protein [Methylobacterium sp. NEAU K]|uniref:hypothetical protein n=1 Tax=Methylobacterium sp. NEAU K TaxID=3064946 RepID=UPI0027334CB9|nr:hypothetical protein [Methylobacterium sp. NEAU K]MDP4005777.1 hypothetical protein [Methylobacterium sp. NEAU K]